MTQANFDVDVAIQALRDGNDLMGKGGVLTPLIKQLTQSALQAEMLPELQAWRERDLDPLNHILWLDAIHDKIRDNGRYITKAVYTLLALTLEGKKERLGLYVSEQEGAHHWLAVLTDLHNRGLRDILIAY